MTAMVPFNPAYGSGQAVTANGTAAEKTNLNAGDQQVCVTNTGSDFAYVRALPTGNASTADYPVPPGAQAIITKGAGTRISYYCATSTTLHIMTGNGW